ERGVSGGRGPPAQPFSGCSPPSPHPLVVLLLLDLLHLVEELARPELQLCQLDADIRTLPGAGEASAPFTFFRTYKDGLWRFESAANPGWYLCTSARAHEPLGLSRGPDATHVLDFYFQLC
uniref:Interleukin-1 receptor antagonist protein n=1 Tax=Apteryx owenii TaxID=8824 RepID=A0A8B9S732_APTOW